MTWRAISSVFELESCRWATTMKPSAGKYQLKGSQEFPKEIQIKTYQPNNNLYRYSYNLGILDLLMQRKRDKETFALEESVAETRQYLAQEYKAKTRPVDRGRFYHAEQGTDFFAISSISLKETEINEVMPSVELPSKEASHTRDKCRKIYVESCPLENDGFINRGSINATPPLNPLNIFDDDERHFALKVKEGDGDKEDEIHVKCDPFPRMDKVCRVARLLGVSLPSKEPHSNGDHSRDRDIHCNKSVDSGDNNSLENQALLRVLNKRF